MASIAFPTLAKKATLADGTTYGYVTVAPASASKPTFLLLHGYPSSSYDWRHQIEALPNSGYGIIAPDLLGYGDTDKPGDVGRYRMKTMCGHMIELLDIEKVQSCIAVGHDWGTGVLSRLATYHTDRFLGFVFISVAYWEPGPVIDVDAVNAMTENAFGSAIYGYWKWHNTEEAVKDCEENPASVFSLLYPTDPELWKTDFGPVGKAATFVRSGQTTASPSWFSPDEQAVRSKIFDKGGYRGPLNWYKAAMQGVNSADEAEVPPEKKPCLLPTLLIVSERDYVLRADMQISRSKEWCPNLKVKTLDCGHWIQLERPAVFNTLLEEFAAEVCK